MLHTSTPFGVPQGVPPSMQPKLQALTVHQIDMVAHAGSPVGRFLKPDRMRSVQLPWRMAGFKNRPTQSHAIGESSGGVAASVGSEIESGVLMWEAPGREHGSMPCRPATTF